MHLNNIFYYSYFYRYKAYRKRIKDILATDINEAKNLLDSVVTEHDNFYQDNDAEEGRHLHHAQDHMNYADQPHQKVATMDALDE